MGRGGVGVALQDLLEVLQILLSHRHLPLDQQEVLPAEEHTHTHTHKHYKHNTHTHTLFSLYFTIYFSESECLCQKEFALRMTCFIHIKGVCALSSQANSPDSMCEGTVIHICVIGVIYIFSSFFCVLFLAPTTVV